MLSIQGSAGAFQLRLINQLNSLNRSIDRNNLRLVTGKRINSPADDPSGFVAVSSRRAELAGVIQATANAEAAKSLSSTASTALTQIAAQLSTIQAKALEAVGGTLSQAEIDANQAEIDAAVEAINGLSETTYNGKRLLDGTQEILVSGKNSAQVDQLTVLERSSASASSAIDVQVTTAATKPTLNYAGTGAARIVSSATFVLTGTPGSASISVNGNELLTAARDRINQQTAVTGVVASVSGTNLIFTGGKFGSAASIQIAVSSGTFNVTGGNGNGTANGGDAVATINGQTVTAAGIQFRYRSSGLKFDLLLNSTYTTGTLGTITASGSGLQFQISPQPGQSAALILPSVHSAHLGGTSGRIREVASGGGKSLNDNQAAAIYSIATDALAQVNAVQVRVGSFESQTLDSMIEVLGKVNENLTESIEQIETVDEALESSQLVRNQMLADNVLSALYIDSTRKSGLVSILQRIAFG